MKSTSYTTQQLDILRHAAADKSNKLIVELGVQQGNTMAVMAAAMPKPCTIYGIDTFESNYTLPPYKATHADWDVAHTTIRNAIPNRTYDYTLFKDDAISAAKLYVDSSIDLLHIDLCNHADNISKVLPVWLPKVKPGGMVILEGGTKTQWQEDNNFLPFGPILENYCTKFVWQIIEFEPGRAMSFGKRIVT